MAFSKQEIHAFYYYDAVAALKLYQDKNKAKIRLKENGITDLEAEDLINEVFKDNKKLNRSLGIKLFFGAGAVSVTLYIILLFTGYLYYVIFPVALILAISGIIFTFFPSGYDVKLGSHEEDS